MAANVEDIYRDHVRELTKEDQIKLITLTFAGLDNGMYESTHERKISELHGLGTQVWRGIDAQVMVSDLRDEWDK